MRYFFLLLLSVFSTQITNSQIYEVGLFVGGSNVIADVGATDYISPNQLAIGGVFKWNRSPRHAFRFSVLFSNLEGVDNKSDDPRREQRNFNFKNNIIELSTGMEFTFFDFDQHDIALKGTPYLYSGISVANHENFYFNAMGETISENSNSWAWAIPMVLGYKLLVSSNLVLSAEVGARYTFTDNIDGSAPDSNEFQQFSFGNTNSNDWYVFSGITLTYTFGQKPCYCNF